MPENEEKDVPAGAQAPTETALARFEREQLTRRQALRKFGITSAMATFALFSVDDLARMVGKAMQQRAGDNKVAERIAEEFHNTGVAQAAYGVPEILLNCARYGVNCLGCCTQVQAICTGLGYDYIVCNAAQASCNSTCSPSVFA